MSLSQYEALAEEIRALCAAIERLESDAADLGIAGGELHAENWYQSLFQHLRPRTAGQPYLVVAVVGGTNTGKSMIFNQLAGSVVSRVSHIACRTKHPVCLVPRNFAKSQLPQQAFPGFRLRPWRSEDDALCDQSEQLLFVREDEEGRQPANLLLLDTPDIDGCLKEHWDRAQLVRQTADVLVAVLTDQKYNDEAVRRFFAEAAAADKPVILVFNMVDWPGKRERCEDWLRAFRAATAVEPLHVYASPRDEQAGMKLRLPFYPLSPGATDLRTDLADLQFGALKLRTFRGALRQVLDDDGLPRFLGLVRQQAERYATAQQVIERTTCIPIDMPAVPSHVIMDELWRWLEPRRTPFDRLVHGIYTRCGQFVLRPLRQSPEKLEAQYQQKEKELLVRGLDRALRTLDDIEGVGNEIVRRELKQLLGGMQREEMFAEVERRYQDLPLVSDNYRRFLSAEMDQFARANRRTLHVVRGFLVTTAVVRPVITIAMLGGPAVIHQVAGHAAAQAILETGSAAAQQAALEAARHGATEAGIVAAQQAAWHAAQEAAAQAGAHTATQVAGEVAFGAAVAVGGDLAVGGGASAGLRALITRIFTGFYQERAALLAAIVNDCLLGDRLRRIRRLANVQNTEPFRSACRGVAQLATCLTQSPLPPGEDSGEG